MDSGGKRVLYHHHNKDSRGKTWKASVRDVICVNVKILFLHPALPPFVCQIRILIGNVSMMISDAEVDFGSDVAN